MLNIGRMALLNLFEILLVPPGFFFPSNYLSVREFSILHMRAKQGKVTKLIKMKDPKDISNLRKDNLCLITYKKCKIYIQLPNKSNLMQEFTKKNKHC